MTNFARPARRRLPWSLLLVPAAAGIPAGLLWWILAPGGLNLITRDPALAAGTAPLVWLPRDLTLAGILVVAGCLLAVFLADGKRSDPQVALLAGLAGALAGSAVAWGTGVLAGRLWGPAVDTGANASIAFSLRAWPVLLLWPAATAVSVFILELVTAAGRQPDEAGMETAGANSPVK
ncbi:hypothetical protein PV772_12330 [Pseudarthrobacter sp. CC12]|uniref:hypothetical protein n=1 Tax=unclassified Pseudarthrobacter TaxID=2647000 RepID=UPI001132302B|nr:hypothetical protein [Pseudarthrobacter sp. NIBRBAC000502771]QDG63948.1 hypothetical protein NIBR502771_17615 [Pseudarthrobacter sp. NIBRBAC000502771]